MSLCQRSRVFAIFASCVLFLIVKANFETVLGDDYELIKKEMNQAIEKSFMKYRTSIVPLLAKCPLVRISTLKIYAEREPNIDSLDARFVECPGGSTTMRLEIFEMDGASPVSKEIGKLLSKELSKGGILDHVPTHIIEFYQNENLGDFPIFTCAVSVFHENLVFSYPCENGNAGDYTTLSSDFLKLLEQHAPIPEAERSEFKRIRGMK